MSEQKYPAKVGFWKNSDNNLRSSIQGLDVEQLALLQSLKLGDRLVLWQVKANEGDSRIPALELKVLKEREPV
jgi:hypothetical protein